MMRNFCAIHIEGAIALEKALNDMEPKIAKKVVKKALRDGAKKIQSAEKTKVISMIGGSMGTKIANGIKVRVFKPKRAKMYGVRAAIIDDNDALRGTSSLGVDYFIPGAIEYGHAFPDRGGGEGAPKDVPGNPAFREAFDEVKGKVHRIIVNEIKKGIERVGAEK